jgi:hypothetical protein
MALGCALVRTAVPLIFVMPDEQVLRNSSTAVADCEVGFPREDSRLLEMQCRFDWQIFSDFEGSQCPWCQDKHSKKNGLLD